MRNNAEVIKLLSADPCLRNVARKLRSIYSCKEIYLVGGYLRDVFLGRRKERLDIDFAVKKGSIALARRMAHELKAGFVVLDSDRGCARVVIKSGNGCVTLDFTDFRGKDLSQDLALRDFTINSLAYDFLSSGGGFNRVIDPFGGIADLRAKVLRSVSDSAFVDDPLRIIRAFSFKAALNFSIDKDTLRSALRHKRLLSDVSSERIRDEFFRILESSGAYSAVCELDSSGILEIFLPEVRIMYGVRQGPYHHLNVWDHSLETLRQEEELIPFFRKNELVRAYLDEEISFSRKRLGLLKFACILHDIGKPEAKVYKNRRMVFYGHERAALKIVRGISDRLKLAHDEYRALKKMILWHLRPGYLSDSVPLTERAKFRYFRDAGDEGASILLLSLADQRSTRGPLSLKKDNRRHERLHRALIKEYFVRKEAKAVKRLINGDDLIGRLKLSPSPLFRKILQEVEEAQAAGEIRSKKDALEMAGKIAANN